MLYLISDKHALPVENASVLVDIHRARRPRKMQRSVTEHRKYYTLMIYVRWITLLISPLVGSERRKRTGRGGHTNGLPAWEVQTPNSRQVHIGLRTDTLQQARWPVHRQARFADARAVSELIRVRRFKQIVE